MNPKLLASLAIIIVLVDIPWLWYISGPFGETVKQIQGGRPMVARMFFAIPVYFALAYLLSIASDWKQAFLIGLCTYAVYDFTNLTTLNHYGFQLAIMDSLWGGTLLATSYYLAKRFKLL